MNSVWIEGKRKKKKSYGKYTKNCYATGVENYFELLTLMLSMTKSQ